MTARAFQTVAGTRPLDIRQCLPDHSAGFGSQGFSRPVRFHGRSVFPNYGNLGKRGIPGLLGVRPSMVLKPEGKLALPGKALLSASRGYHWTALLLLELKILAGAFAHDAEGWLVSDDDRTPMPAAKIDP
jgi:hypothetical protein